MAILKQGFSSEVLAKAEQIFETKPISEIREIQQKLRSDVETKKQDLRQIVGDSYRDLIASADNIVTISNNCNAILANIVAVQERLAFFAIRVSSSVPSSLGAEGSSSAHAAFHAIGKRVKYLVDTPEIIWGCLDSHQLLEGAKRYLRAQRVYHSLQDHFPSEALDRFPLLNHQWVLVRKFNKQILDKVTSVLDHERALQQDQVVDALAALAVLQELDSQQLLHRFLGHRKVWILQEASSGCSLVAKTDDGARLEQLMGSVRSLQTCMIQVLSTFLASSAESASDAPAVCQLERSLQEDEMDSSELFFAGPLGAHTGSIQATTGPEVSQWGEYIRNVLDRVRPLSINEVLGSCKQWLSELQGSLLEVYHRLMAGCGLASALASMEKQVKEVLQAWEIVHARAPSDDPVTTSYNPDSVKDSLASLANTVWQLLLYPVFVDQAKRIVDDGFDQVKHCMEKPLQACVDQINTSTMESAGKVHVRVWPAVPENSLASLRRQGSTISSHHLKRTVSLPTPHKERSRGIEQCRQRVGEVVTQLDQELRKVLEAVVDHLLTQDGRSTWRQAGSRTGLARGTSSEVGAVLGPRASGPLPPYRPQLKLTDPSDRNGDIQGHVQKRCRETLLAISSIMRRRLSALPPASLSVEGAATAEQAVLVGRVCHHIADHMEVVPLILGPPDLWGSTATGGSKGGPGQGFPSSPLARRVGPLSRMSSSFTPRTMPGEPSPELGEIREIAIMAFRSWSQWAARCLAEQYLRGLQEDQLLVSNTTPLSWSEVLVSTSDGHQQDEEQQEGGQETEEEVPTEMRFRLPASPSMNALCLAGATCKEMRRAGDHEAGLEALQVLVWEVGEAVMDGLQEVLGEGTELRQQLTEPGALQLLMDIRFLTEVLTGGRPLLPQEASGLDKGGLLAAVAGALAVADNPDSRKIGERRQRVARLEGQLQDTLDPIDWATYEPYLWENLKRSHARLAVLLGSLYQLRSRHGEDAALVTKAALPQDINIINILPVAPRFHYLPISTPTTGPPGNQARDSSTALGPSGLVSKMMALSEVVALNTSGTALSADLGGEYSFSDLGTKRQKGDATNQGLGTLQETGDVGGEDSLATSTALGALQAKLQAGSLGSFSTLLGDKAAEMTTMAQQRIGDYLPAGAFGTSLLSSLAKNMSKK